MELEELVAKFGPNPTATQVMTVLPQVWNDLDIPVQGLDPVLERISKVASTAASEERFGLFQQVAKILINVQDTNFFLGLIYGPQFNALISDVKAWADYQTGVLYEARNILKDKGRNLTTMTLRENYINDLLSTTWAKSYGIVAGDVDLPLVKTHELPEGAAYMPEEGKWGQIGFSYGDEDYVSNEFVVLHEFCHFLNEKAPGQRTDGHGPNFAGIFLDGVETIMGKAKGTVLLDSFEKHGVQCNRPVKVLS